MATQRFWVVIVGVLLFWCVLSKAWASYDISINKEVNNPNPTGPDQTIEFKVTVEHLRGASVGTVVIRDKLPSALRLPDVMVPYVSAGKYDIDSGEWVIELLQEGQREVLIIPAVYSDGKQSPCAVNIAKFISSSDFDASNNESRVALRAPGVEACVDLWISASKEVDVKDPCDPDKQLTYTFDVTNAGPDDARNVRFSIAEIGQFKMPGLRFISSGCTGFECGIELLRAGDTHSFIAQSKVFSAQPVDGHSLRMSATTESNDYATENNSSDHKFQFGGNEGFCLGGGGSGGAASCFIATAAYGSPLDERITVLRRFRDRWLLTNAPGKAIVKNYYRYSPAFAKRIAEKPVLRALVRAFLYPIIFVLSYPLSSLNSLMLLALCILWRQRLRASL
ncbi:DUF11 domain-containing protein [Seongchinamella unica]|uniref:DUF11 domain-containing protein n=1 Tax=Seongchinamella unica TaxID=2547392 RepID=A0A4R5LMN0_9GAMM|nr:DUF11 domain-containing protein [Seongchinamella unica]TDG11273.1 DUF11 domain-containing protein [Seongchinamella unica]